MSTCNQNIGFHCNVFSLFSDHNTVFTCLVMLPCAVLYENSVNSNLSSAGYFDTTEWVFAGVAETCLR